jgi:Na+-translocating ferredoxin:NAD+ oxidoreductase RnfG subunit
MTGPGIVFLCIVGAIVIFLVIAFLKGWLSTHATSFTAYTMMHDMVNADKQQAIEIVMDVQAGKEMEKQESGEDKDPGRSVKELYEKAKQAEKPNVA